jgi:hypothetical protein
VFFVSGVFANWALLPALLVLLKALASGLLVFAILRSVSKLGDRTSGMASGLPFTSAPALLWMALDRDITIVIATVTDTMITASGYAAFAVVLLACARFLRGWMLYAFAATSTIALVRIEHSVFTFSEPTMSAVLVCAVLLCGCRLLLSQSNLFAAKSDATQRQIPVKRSALNSFQKNVAHATVAFALVLITLLLDRSSPRWVAAALVGLPVVSATVLSCALASGSPDKALRTAEGFINGCLIRTCFCFVFALLLPTLGVGAAFACALALALAIAGLIFYRTRVLSSEYLRDSQRTSTRV